MANFQTILIPARDLTAARELYSKLLGTGPSADSEYYVGYDVDGQHVGLVPGDGELTAYLHVEDLDGTIEQITAAGGSVLEEPKSVGGPRRVAVVSDPSGARVGLLSDAG